MALHRESVLVTGEHEAPDRWPVTERARSYSCESGGTEVSMGDAAEKAYQTIRNGIINGCYGQGSHLTARLLAAALGLSRTPVREALLRLHSEGLIQIIPNCGAFVSRWNVESVEQYFDLCVPLEELGAGLAAKRASDSDIEVLRAMVEEINSLVAQEAPSVLDMMEANGRLHRKIMSICGNDLLERFLSLLIEPLVVLSAFRHFSLEELRRAATQLEELVAAMAARDPAWARNVMAKHLLSARHAIRRSLRVSGDGESPADVPPNPSARRRESVLKWTRSQR